MADITAARRFKKQGMSWPHRNANPFLKLRQLILYGELYFIGTNVDRNFLEMLLNPIT